MTIQEFFTKYDGQGIDFDKAYGFQCMDLAEQYNQDVVHAPRLGGNAIDVWTGYPKNSYTQVANTPEGVPQLGDMVIWGTGLGQYGHIAVFKEGDTNSFTSFDQNYPIGSKCHFQTHNYDNVLGWLHPIMPQSVDQKTLDDIRTARDSNWNLYQNELSTNNELTKKVGDLTSENQGLKTELSQVNQSNSTLASELQKKNEEDATAIDAGLQAEIDLKDAQKVIQGHYAHFKVTNEQEYQKAITELESSHEELVKNVTETQDGLAEGAFTETPPSSPAPNIFQRFVTIVGDFFKNWR